MNQELIEEKFYEMNGRFFEIFESRKLYNWSIDKTPVMAEDGVKHYLVYKIFTSSVNAYIEDINDSSLSVSTLYNVFDEFKDYVKKNLINPVIFEHLNISSTEKGDKFVVIFKTYVFGIN